MFQPCKEIAVTNMARLTRPVCQDLPTRLGERFTPVRALHGEGPTRTADSARLVSEALGQLGSSTFDWVVWCQDHPDADALTPPLQRLMATERIQSSHFMGLTHGGGLAPIAALNFLDKRLSPGEQGLVVLIEQGTNSEGPTTTAILLEVASAQGGWVLETLTKVPETQTLSQDPWGQLHEAIHLREGAEHCDLSLPFALRTHLKGRFRRVLPLSLQVGGDIACSP